MATQSAGGPAQDVTQILTTDHQEMLELLGRIQRISDPEERRDLADTVTAEIMRHAVAEEMYVYPVMEDDLPDGHEDVEHDKREHDEIVQTLKKIEDADPSSLSFMTLIQQLEAQVRHHGEDEELEQFPKMRAHLSRETLLDLGRKVENAKKIAPTRPHPSAPHSELFHKTIGAGVGLVDRLRDKLTGRATGQDG